MLLPFVALSLVSAQLMPGRAADGTLTLVRCTGEGEQTLVIDAATGEPVAAEADRCAWATAQVAAALPDVPAGPVVARIARAVPSAAPAALPILDAVPAPRSARGPLSLA